MIRAIEEWELKYYKLSINKRFKFFKWDISFSFQILNNQIHKEWEKRIQNIIDNSVTISSNDKDVYYNQKSI